MRNFLLKRLISHAAGKLDGYKTKIGGAGLILSGLAGVIGLMYPDQGLPQMDLTTALTLLSSGFVALGVGGKLEKLKQAGGDAEGQAGSAQ